MGLVVYSRAVQSNIVLIYGKKQVLVVPRKFATVHGWLTRIPSDLGVTIGQS